MMKDLLWAESQKLHRSKILWIAGFATVMVGLIVFAQGQFTFYDRRYIDGAGWFMTAAQSLATFYVLPAVIALLGSYMICREEQEDTLKSLRLIPVDEVKLTLAKMILAFVFSVLIYLLLFAITFLVEAVLHLEALSVGLVLENLKIYFLDGVGVFFAISPIVALVARMKKGYWLALVFAEIYSFAGLFASMSQQLKTVYPMTAVFNISGYYNSTVDGCGDRAVPTDWGTGERRPMRQRFQGGVYKLRPAACLSTAIQRNAAPAGYGGPGRERKAENHRDAYSIQRGNCSDRHRLSG